MNFKPLPLITFLDDLENPRRSGACDHKLIDILMIAFCTIMSGGESWEDMALYGKENREYRCCWVFNEIEQLSFHEQWQGFK